jgi:hypothetical protein
VGYESNTKVVLTGKGEGGLAELLENLSDDASQYGYLRVITGDNESRRTKFVFVSWCGANVGALKRAKMSVHKASVKTIIKVLPLTSNPSVLDCDLTEICSNFYSEVLLLTYFNQDFAVEVHAEHKDELNEEALLTKVRKAGGADYSGNKSQEN